MDAVGREADHDVAGLDVVAVDDAAAFDDADGEAGQVELAFAVEVGHFGGFAAEQGAVGLAASVGDALDDGGGVVGIELVDAEVIEEEEGSAPTVMRSLTLIATRSMPRERMRPAAMPSRTFVPTPSVQPTSTGWR